MSTGLGRFQAEPGPMDRVEGARLRSMFLPKLSREGQKAIGDNLSFVRCQLNHYGVQIEEKEFSGNGTALMKKVLQEGKCDRVPGHILELQQKMHVEWLGQRTPAQLSTLPDYVIAKYFLSFGQPDPTKTTFIVGIPLGRDIDVYSEEMTKAASNIAGLYHKKALGLKTHTLFIGWDAAAVEKAASGHVVQEKSLDINHGHTPV